MTATQPLPGLFLVESRVFRDHRGSFVKTFHEPLFASLGIPPVQVREQFWSSSARGVLRGMHFQMPPADHEKIVTCVAGRVLDVVVDLRRGPGYGKVWSGELSADNGRILVIPKGFAHGFLSLEEGSVMHYQCSTVHTPASDAGIRWDSFGFDWPLYGAPVLSTRDAGFPTLADFDSPFNAL
jgi:dTDP-4-dehydrorhamnose 3,5-epimerase/CDP-3, 6-dideoxy-D-glycero-D-glycero-4-hexulose-5-epimerase